MTVVDVTETVEVIVVIVTGVGLTDVPYVTEISVVVAEPVATTVIVVVVVATAQVLASG